MCILLLYVYITLLMADTFPAHSKTDLNSQFHVIILGREKEPLNLTKEDRYEYAYGKIHECM